jgi:hypothetical protein
MADDDVGVLAQGEKRGGFIGATELERRFVIHVGVRGHDMGEGRWATCGETSANGGARVRALACARVLWRKPQLSHTNNERIQKLKNQNQNSEQRTTKSSLLNS